MNPLERERGKAAFGPVVMADLGRGRGRGHGRRHGAGPVIAAVRVGSHAPWNVAAVIVATPARLHRP